MKALKQCYLPFFYSPENNRLLEKYHHYIEQVVPQCAEGFYRVLMEDSSSKKFLTTQLVENHLKTELQRWLLLTLSAKHKETDIQEVVAKQHQVGEVHSRVEVPMGLVNSAMVVIKEVLFDDLAASKQVQETDKVDFIIVLNQILDASLSLVNESYLQGKVLNERMAQEYRSNSSAHEVALELERVRGTMLGWVAQFMTDLISCRAKTVTNIQHQEFVLWIRHKLSYACRNDELIQKAKVNLDTLQKTIDELGQDPEKNRDELVLQVNHLTTECSWILSQISEMNIEMAAREDTLTSLIERRFLAPILQNETHQALQSKQPYCVMMMDIDNFKQINDIYGHQSGDHVLAHIGLLLKRSLRVTDYAFRYGGEEFLILMPETTLNKAELAAEKLLDIVRQSNIKLDNGRVLKVTMSIGLAEFADHPDFEQLIKMADEKLYQAKHNGKDRYEC